MIVKHEHSYGIIPLKKKNHVWNVLIVQLHAGHWGFPKGHPEPHETHLETARRELFEETGLTPKKLLTNQTLEEEYFFKMNEVLIHKKVTYFIYEVKGKVIRLIEEIKALQWVPLSEASHYVTFDETKRISQQVESLIEKS